MTDFPNDKDHPKDINIGKDFLDDTDHATDLSNSINIETTMPAITKITPKTKPLSLSNNTNVKIIPTSERADGSIRKERRIKPGYRPQEEISKYIPPARRNEKGPSSLTEQLEALSLQSENQKANKGEFWYKLVDKQYEKRSIEEYKGLWSLDE